MYVIHFILIFISLLMMQRHIKHGSARLASLNAFVVGVIFAVDAMSVMS